MSDQARLFKPPPADGSLGTRQSFVLELLRDHPNGLRATDIGRQLHVDRDSPCACSEDIDELIQAVTCKYAKTDAEGILRSLRGDGKGAEARKLVAYRREPGRWVASTGVRHLPDPTCDPGTSPFPNGF